MRDHTGLAGSRTTVVAILILATVLALVWRADIFSRVLFAFSAAGSAFGPILIMRLLGRELSPAATLSAMLSGFGLTVFISWLPDLPGDFAERILPFIAAMTIAIIGSQGQSPLLLNEGVSGQSRAPAPDSDPG